MPPSRWQILAVLSAGLVSVSAAATLIRLAAAPSIVTAAYRLAIASLVLTPFFWFTLGRRRTELSRTTVLLSTASGGFLALHFAFWIESLSHTSVTSSVLLVAMNPIFLGIGTALFLRERVSRRVYLAILLGVIGMVIVSARELMHFSVSRDALYGNLLALAGAVMGSSYMLLGRRIRQGVSILSYVYLTYTAAAVLLVLGAIILHQPFTGYAPKVYGLFVLLALFPQLVGHSSFNWALRHISAPIVGLIILGEPIGASIIAWIVLRETPTSFELLGGIVLLAGIALAIREIGAGPASGEAQTLRGQS